MAVKSETKKAAASPFSPDALALPKIEIPEIVREMAEKTVAQAKVNYDKMRSAAEEATDVLEDTYETTRKGMIELNMKALDTAKENTDATFSFIKTVMAAKSVSEAIELQTAFVRKQFETLTGQAKEFQEFTTKLATETGAPLKEAFAKATKDFKAAA